MADEPIYQGYARALFEMARAEDAVGQVEEELFRLRELLAESPDLLKFLKDPNIKREGKRQALAELFGARVHAVVLNGLLALSDSDRAGDLGKVIDAYMGVAASSKQQVSGEVTTAIPLEPALRERIETVLGQTTGKNVQLFERVDPAILGGAIIQVGDQVIDGSLRRKLDQLSEQLRK
jgi:F-type H+-transporting ATPase subunit delta